MTAKNKLGLLDLTMITVSLVIGMGIFRTPASVAADSPNVFVFYAAWLMGGLVALCGALSYAEIGSRLPVTGGYYKVFSYAYHPSIAFGINCVILVSNASSGAAVAIVGAEYITGVLVPQSLDKSYMDVADNAEHIRSLQLIIAIVEIAIFYGVNMFGLRLSAKTQTILTLFKIGLVVLLILPLFITEATPAQITDSTISPGFKEYLKAFGLGLVAVSFTYGGYQQAINFGAEVENPSKKVPRGILFGILIIVALYFLINLAYVHVIGFQELKTSRNIAAIMASKVLGTHAEQILSIMLFVGVLAYINVLLLSNPRVMYAMVDDGVMPKAFQKRNSRGAMPVGLTVFAGIAMLAVFVAKEFDRLISFSIFLDCFGMILSVGSIFILRKNTKHLDGTGIYKMKLYPLLPLVFMAAYAFVAVALLITKTALAFTGLGVLAVFILLYFVLKKISPNRIN